jgi:hypothetical protein
VLQTGLQPIYKPDLPGEAAVTLADITESKRLGWEPKFDLHKGLHHTISYIREKVLTSKGVKRLLGEKTGVAAGTEGSA